MTKFQDELRKLAGRIHGAAQTDIPAGQLRDQAASGTIPPATGTKKGGVKLSDAEPQPLGTADPSGDSDVSRSGHVHAHGNLGGGSLHAVATGSAAGFMSAADKAKEDLYPPISGLTPGDVLTALTSSTVGFAPPSGGGGLPAGAPGDMIYFDATSTPVLLEMSGVPEFSAIYAENVAGTQIPVWDIRRGLDGDVDGTFDATLVVGLQGFPISSADPIAGEALVYDGSLYSPLAVQPLDADLTALAALSGTGLAARTAADTWAQRSIVGTSNRITLTDGNGVSGNPTIDIASTYVGQTSLTTLGTVATGVWQGTKIGLAYGGTNADLSATGGANQFLKQSSSGAAITVGALVAGDIPDLSATYQPLDGDLTALAALSGTGLAARTAANTWAQRAITGTASRLSVTNGDGVSGNPTLNIDTGYVGQSSITTLGTVGTGVWQGTKVGLTYGGTNADLSATGGTGQYLKQASTGATITVGAIPSTDLTYSGLTAGQVLRATGASAAAFGALDLANSNAITGTLPAANGGSGQSSYAVGDLLYASGSAALSKLADVATGNALISGGVTTAPSWGKIGLTTHVSGVLPEANGGSGVAARPAFAAHKNGTNQTGIVANTFTKATFSTERFDTNGNFASSTFTPTIAGRYLLLATAYWVAAEAGKIYYTLIYKNGVLDQQFFTTAVAAGVLNAPLVCYIDANGSTDYFEMYVYHTSVGNMTLAGQSTATTFAGSYL